MLKEDAKIKAIATKETRLYDISSDEVLLWIEFIAFNTFY